MAPYRSFLLNMLMSFVFLGMVLNSFSQIDEMSSHESMLDISSFDKKTQETILDLEKNWYCVGKKDSLFKELKSYKVNDFKLKSYIQLLEAFRFINNNNFNQSFSILEKCEAQENFPFLGRVHFQEASIYFKKHEYINALKEIQIAESIFKKRNIGVELIYSKMFLLDLCIIADNTNYAQSTYLELITLCQKYNNNRGLALAYRGYGLYIAKRDTSLAKELLFKNWELLKRISSSSKINDALHYLKFLARYKLYDEFYSVFEQVSAAKKTSCYLADWSVANTYYAQIKSEYGDYDSARYYNKLALTQRKILGNKILIGLSYVNLASNSLSQMNYKDAKICLDSAKMHLISRWSAIDKRYYYHYLLKYFQAIDNKDSVISVYNRLSALDHSFYLQQEDEFISRQQLKSEIRNILINEKYLAENDLQKKKLWTVIFITFLLIVVLFIISKQYFQKSKKLNILKIKNYSNHKKISNYEREISQLKSIFQNDITGFIILDKNKKITFVNKRAEMFLRKPLNKIISQTILGFIDERYIAIFDSSISETCKNGINNEVQVKLINNDKWVNLSISPLYINEELESIIIIAQDISSRIQALDSEKEQKSVLQTLFNSVTESIILLDINGEILSINDTGAKRLGSSYDQLVGTDYFKTIPKVLRHERMSRIKKVIEAKKADVYSESVDSYNNLVSLYPNFDKEGEVNYIAEFTMDITDRKLAHEQINSLRQKVLRSQMNPHFIFNSLNAIQSYILKNDTELAVKYLNSFAKLIRMILDGSRYDYISLRKEIHLLEYYLQLQQLRFGDKFSWTLDVDSSIDTESCLIPVMLAQPFIENSIEHGIQLLEGKGNVKIQFKRLDEIIVFKVSDNGIGREASKEIQKNSFKSNESLSTEIFKERLFTLNKFSNQKITYNIIDLKDDNDKAKGTMVVINMPIIYRSNII